jgi:hypothetical protein
MDWAGEIHNEVATAIDRFVSFVRVNTGDEARPTGAGFVLWVGGETQPTNMSGGDIWMSEGEPVPTAPSIITSSLNALNEDAVFSQTLVATGTTPITWTVTAGSLPAGLTLDDNSGEISGTPTTEGAYSFTVTATNTIGDDVQAFTGTVGAPLVAPTITTTTLDAMTQGISFSQTLAATGSTPMTWAVTTGSMISGLTLNASTGAITGTPAVSGAYSFTITATNGAGSDPQAYSGTITAGVAPPVITTTSLSSLTVGSSFSQTLAATGGTPITWATTSGSLPAGLSLNTSTGAITGTPTTAGAYSFTITATNSAGSDPQAFSGTVNEPSTGEFWFGALTPDSTNLYSDGGANIITGDHFYATVPFTVLGVRVWNPASADSTFLNTDVTVYAWGRDWPGSTLDSTDNPGWSSPDASKTDTAARTAGTWTAIYFDTPLSINAVSSGANDPDCVLIGVRFGTAGYYVIITDSTVGSVAVESQQNDDVFMAEQAFERSAATVNGTTGVAPPSGATWYGVDLIYEV